MVGVKEGLAVGQGGPHPAVLGKDAGDGRREGAIRRQAQLTGDGPQGGDVVAVDHLEGDSHIVALFHKAGRLGIVVPGLFGVGVSLGHRVQVAKAPEGDPADLAHGGEILLVDDGPPPLGTGLIGPQEHLVQHVGHHVRHGAGRHVG